MRETDAIRSEEAPVYEGEQLFRDQRRWQQESFRPLIAPRLDEYVPGEVLDGMTLREKDAIADHVVR